MYEKKTELHTTKYFACYSNIYCRLLLHSPNNILTSFVRQSHRIVMFLVVTLRLCFDEGLDFEVSEAGVRLPGLPRLCIK